MPAPGSDLVISDKRKILGNQPAAKTFQEKYNPCALTVEEEGAEGNVNTLL